jgi:hypothetical protein
MCIRLEGSSKPLDPLDDLIPDEDDEDDIGAGVASVNGLEASTDTAVRVERIPTFVLEPQTVTITVFVTNAPQPLVFGQETELKGKRSAGKGVSKPKAKGHASDDEDDIDDDDVDAFYASMMKAKKALPSDWRAQLRKYTPRRSVQRVVLEQVPKSFSLLDLKVAAASLAKLELTAAEAGAVALWRERRSEVTEVPLSPEPGEDDAVAEVRRRLLQAARRHAPAGMITGPARESDAEADLRSLPASALGDDGGCSFRWETVEFDNEATLWQLELDCRGKEHNVLELQFDLDVCAGRAAEAANEAAARADGLIVKTEYGSGKATAAVVKAAIEARQKLKMQQVSYQLARDGGLISDDDIEKKNKEGGACSTKMLIVYMIVYIVAVAAWFMHGKAKTTDGKADKLKDAMKGIYGKTKFDL